MTRTITVEIAPKHGHVIVTGDHLIIADLGGDVALFDVDDLVSIGAALVQAGLTLDSPRRLFKSVSQPDGTLKAPDTNNLFIPASDTPK